MSEPTPEMIDAGFAKAAQFTTVVDRQELAAIYTAMRALERPSDEAVKRVARAMRTELRNQGVIYEDEPLDVSMLMMQTGEAADIYALARAAIAAMREQSK